MNKRILKTISFTLQGLYSVACIVNVLLCILYRFNFDTSFGRKYAYFALDVTGILTLILIPVILISLILNILAMPEKEKKKKERFYWFFWIICSPCVYIISFIVSATLLVAMTGGV